MTRIESALAAAGAWAVAGALVLGLATTASAADLGGATPAAAGTAIDVPAQVFPHDPTSAKPVLDLKSAPDLSSRERNWAVGRSLRLDLPVGAGQRLPVLLHIFSSEEICHENQDFTAAAAVRNQEQDFIRGGDH